MESYEKLYDSICRLCLKSNTIENMIPLFENGCVNYYGQAIIPFAKIALEKEDFLPSSMCRRCLILLKQCIYFKFMCEASDRHLKQLKSLVSVDFKQKLVKHTLLKFNKCNNMSNKPFVQTKIDTQGHEASGKIVTNFERNLFDNSNDSWDMSRKQQKVDDPDKLLDNLEKLVYLNDDLSDTDYLTWPRKVKRRSKNIKTISYVRKRVDRKRICHVCHKELPNYQIYFRHMQKHRGSRFICEYCGKGSNTQADLQVHQVAVHGAGPCLQCPQCPFKASRRFDMVEHERIHTGERPFACEKCGLTFRRKEIHRKHLIIHSEKTIQCSHCPKKFFKRTDMLEHCNSNHERQYMFVCNECGTMYAKTSTVRRHLVEKHGIPRERQKKIIRVKTGKIASCHET